MAPVRADSGISRVEVAELSVHYRRVGSGRPPFLLVHGAGASAAHFRVLARLLSRHRTTVAIDLPGHGKTADWADQTGQRLERYRELVAVFAERIGLGRFVLVGHSMGGAVGLELALHYPRRLAGLVLVATAATLRSSRELGALRARSGDWLARFVATRGFSPATSPPLANAMLREHLGAPEAVAREDFIACDAFDVRGKLSEIQCSTTVVAGADDQITPLPLVRRLAEAIPHAVLVEVTRAGHQVCQERPAAVAAAILARHHPSHW